MFLVVFHEYLENYNGRVKLSIDEMILMISPTKVFVESKLLDNSLLELLPLKDNQVSNSGSWEPHVLFFFSFKYRPKSKQLKVIKNWVTSVVIYNSHAIISIGNR